ncbi:hypothetical protein [Aliiglaciecola lipolytica]|uniref:Uncharacterized protein n=1 Tax=Aliiglaciecola lipolytica E3 TaxID=1127673 RepID=K6Y9P3_9ALTE|nr:hypothetical protein [Aliiglaciecola lipolytica]GAC13363.1 hypothetical protein GLIP_0717 [Aliiglaciecola lipolytica E3]
MKLSSLTELSGRANYHLIVGDCATNHIPNYVSLSSDIYSRQIQGGIGCENEFDNLTNARGILLFVSWANAIAVIENESQVETRIKSHLLVVEKLSQMNFPVLMIDRHGFLDRYCSNEILQGRESLSYPEALRVGWRPQSAFEQMKRRLMYRDAIRQSIGRNISYFDLYDYLGTSTYRHESGECKNNLVNVAPWHYDVPSYEYGAKVYKAFVDKKDYVSLIENWELGVLDIKTLVSKTNI